MPREKYNLAITQAAQSREALMRIIGTTFGDEDDENPRVR
jgi:hypothetical protein